MPPINNQELIRRERRLLQQVRLRSFTVSPTTVRPLESVTLEWDVDLDTSEPNSFKVRLGNNIVSDRGTRTDIITSNKNYDLYVVGSFTERRLASRSVAIDGEDIIEIPIAKSIIESGVEIQLNNRIDTFSDISVRSTDGLVTITDTGLSLRFLLKYAIEEYFNPNIDINLHYRMEIRRSGSTNQVNVSSIHSKNTVDMWFTTGQHIGSVGTASVVQHFGQKFLRSFLLISLANETAQAIEDTLNELADNFLTNDQRLFKVEFSEFAITLCGHSIPEDEA